MAPRRSQLARRRKSVGLTQESLAETLGVDRTTVVRWERGDSEPQPWQRRGLAAALDVSLDRLADLLTPDSTSTSVDNAPCFVDTVSVANDEDGGDHTDRRSFTALAALATLGSVGPMRDVLVAADAPMRLGLAEVQWAASLMSRLRQADSITGANTLCDLAIAIHRRLVVWSRRSSYTGEVGAALQGALADLANQIGWLAIDAERHPEARYYLHEAISRSRIADDPRAEVRALACLSLLTRETEPRESMLCAEAAQRVSAGWATPRLRTLLHLRAAHAYAHQHDVSSFGRELAKAKSQLDKGPHEDDLLFLQFVNPREAAGLEGLSYLALNRADRAVTAFRMIVEDVDPEHRRNDVLHHLNVARAERQAGDVAEAARVALDVLPSVLALQSRRASRRMRRFRDDLRAHHAIAEVRAFVTAYDEGTAA